MARSSAVWGIDIGQCSLKALRCRPGDAPGQLVADAFDYIEYPKILSQPGADPAELIRDALKQFLSRNSVRGDRVAISVSGQSGLARFIKLPPVEVEEDPRHRPLRSPAADPLRSERRDLGLPADGRRSEEEGFALETEVGLFAMKRDQVFRALEPFNERRHRGRHRPADAAGALQLPALRPAAATCRRPTSTIPTIRPRRS